MDLQYLISLKPDDFNNRDVSMEEILEWFQICRAYWQHSGDPNDPHVMLTSGKHSNGFFDCLRVLQYLNLSDILANQLARKIRVACGGVKADYVIGSPMAGITFAHDVARALGATCNMFTEKDGDAMTFNRIAIPPNSLVLQVEELITTRKTTNAVQNGIDSDNPDAVVWLPVIGSLVYRPAKFNDSSEQGGRTIISLIAKEIWSVKPEECPLCASGSKIISKPKKNWAALTGKN
ncbi:MAG: hypothetical protein WC453_03275 [Patescibacteria group bacterium]